MLALLSCAGLAFSLAQFLRSSCSEPPATKSAVIEAVRQELQRCDEEAAAAKATTQSAKRQAQHAGDAMQVTAEQ